MNPVRDYRMKMLAAYAMAITMIGTIALASDVGRKLMQKRGVVLPTMGFPQAMAAMDSTGIGDRLTAEGVLGEHILAAIERLRQVHGFPEIDHVDAILAQIRKAVR